MKKFISTLDLPSGATMAHVAAAVGIMPSVTQARKNGFDRPITLGLHVLTKKKVHVEIVDRPLTEEEKGTVRTNIDRPDLEPGFWSEFVPPSSHVSWAIQFPLNDPMWQERIISAFIKDAAKARKKVDKSV